MTGFPTLVEITPYFFCSSNVNFSQRACTQRDVFSVRKPKSVWSNPTKFPSRPFAGNSVAEPQQKESIPDKRGPERNKTKKTNKCHFPASHSKSSLATRFKMQKVAATNDRVFRTCPTRLGRAIRGIIKQYEKSGDSGSVVR